jgi:DNA-directed RNA polymerase specialized sigma24 family protein
MAGDDDESLTHPHDRRVLTVIRAVLLENRYPQHELEDGVGTVEVRAWASKPRPATVGKWKALCRKIAKELAIDRTRSEIVGGKESERPTDLADEREASNSGDTMDAAIDRRRAIEEIAALLSEEERPVFLKLALGSSQAEIAKDLRMRPREVSRHVSSMRQRFVKVLAPVGLMAVLAVGAWLLFKDKLGPDDQAHNQTPSPSSVPSAPPGPSPEQLARLQQQRAKAEELRKLASAECASGSWTTCNNDLEKASDQDPEGEHTRRVKRLWGEVNRGLIQQEIESKGVPAARSLRPDEKAKVVAAIAASRGQTLRLVCAPGAEPSHLCDQLAAAITSAGWTVTRTNVGADAGLPHRMVIEVSTDAAEATQDAADALAAGLEKGYLLAYGPEDMPPGGDAPLRLTVGAP